MCPGLVNTEPFHQPAILLRGQHPGFTLRTRPLERTRLQSFIQQYETIAFPIQSFDSIPASATEQEQCIGKWIQRKLLLNNCCQTINPSAQICIATGDVHLVGSSKVTQHDCKIRSTVSIVASSAPL